MVQNFDPFTQKLQTELKTVRVISTQNAIFLSTLFSSPYLHRATTAVTCQKADVAFFCAYSDEIFDVVMRKLFQLKTNSIILNLLPLQYTNDA